MRFALFPNLTKKDSVAISLKIYEFLTGKGENVVVEDEKAEALKIPPLSSVPPHEIDFLISLGGDGTILRILHLNPELKAPIIGINMGGLGFMADIPIEEIYKSLEDILKGDYIVDERLVIEGKTALETSFAVNEIVIHRSHNPCLIDLKVYVGGVYLNSFSADGLIISTPNGSTAYSLAAGGPILTPDLKGLVITPICPHTISNRPIVVGSDQEITVEYFSEHDPVEITYDGFTQVNISSGESVHIRPSHRKFRMVSFQRLDFFTTLRSKLGWVGKSKSI